MPGAEEESQTVLGVAFLSDGWLARRTNRESSGQDRVIDSVPERPYDHQGYGLRVLRTPALLYGECRLYPL